MFRIVLVLLLSLLIASCSYNSDPIKDIDSNDSSDDVVQIESSDNLLSEAPVESAAPPVEVEAVEPSDTPITDASVDVDETQIESSEKNEEPVPVDPVDTPNQDIKHPDPSTFTDAFVLNYDMLQQSTVILTENSFVEYVVEQDVVSLEDAYGLLTMSLLCENYDTVYGRDFYIEVQKDGLWYRLPHKAFPEIAIIGKAGKEYKESLYLKEWYSSLEPGVYRVVKQILVEDQGSYWYGDEFIIE